MLTRILWLEMSILATTVAEAGDAVANENAPMTSTAAISAGTLRTQTRKLPPVLIAPSEIETPTNQDHKACHRHPWASTGGARNSQALTSTAFIESSQGTFIDVKNRLSIKRPNVVRQDSLFRQIERLANSLPLVRCHATATGIHIEPMCRDGLPISVYRSEGRQTICLGSWYDDLDHDAMVFNLVEKATKGQLRLRMEGDGRKFHTFTVEVHVRDDVWIEVGQMSNYWLRKKPVRVVKYLRNKIPVRSDA